MATFAFETIRFDETVISNVSIRARAVRCYMEAMLCEAKTGLSLAKCSGRGKVGFKSHTRNRDTQPSSYYTNISRMAIEETALAENNRYTINNQRELFP